MALVKREANSLSLSLSKEKEKRKEKDRKIKREVRHLAHPLRSSIGLRLEFWHLHESEGADTRVNHWPVRWPNA